MRLVRFRHGERIATGVLSGEEVRVIRGTFFEDPVPTGEDVPLGDVRLLAPVLPSKIVAVARNYPEHAAELGNPLPERPMLFFKPATSVIGPGDPIPIPEGTTRVDHEAELAAVIGRLCRRDWQKSDGQWARAKGSDGFGPLGPWVETDVDVSDLAVASRVNGEDRQSGRTSEMVFSPAWLVSYISRTITLLPGDVVLTGTPPGVGPMQPGDRVEVEVQGIGVLENGVVAGG